MKWILRTLGIVVALLLVLFIGAALILPRVLKPAAYEARLQALVHQKTGRNLAIRGSVALSFFPWLGVVVHDVALSNQAGFEPGTLARVGSAEVRVRLLPLFAKRVEISEVRLEGLQVSLVKDKAGQTNWSGLGGAQTQTPAAPAAPAAPGHAPLLQALSVAGVQVRHSGLVWTDEQSGQRIRIQNLDLSVGRVAAGTPVPVSVKGEVQIAQPALQAPFAIKARVIWQDDPAVLSVDHLVAHFAGAAMQGALHVRPGRPLTLGGTLEMADTNVASVLARLGMPVHFRDPKALTHVGLSVSFEGTPAAIRFAPVTASLDGSQWTGNADWRSAGGQSTYAFGLAADRLDIDRYRTPAGPAAAPAAAAPPPASAQAAQPLPSKALRAVNLVARLRIAHLTAFGLHLEAVRTAVSAHQGLLTLTPLAARLYGGRFTGAVTYDVRGPVPQVAVTERLSQVAMGPLLHDARVFDKFSGTGTVDGAITASGATTPALTQSLNGTARIALLHGQIKGVDLAKIIGQVRSVAAQLKGQAAPAVPANGGNTDFSSLTATAVIHDGVVHNNDLALAAPPYFTATGQGTVDLVHKTLSYGLLLDGQADHRNFSLPVHVTGPFGGVSYQADLRSVLRARAQQQLKSQGKRLKSRLQQELNNRLQNLLH